MRKKMKQMSRSFLVIMTAAAIMISAVPVGVYATEPDTDFSEEEIYEAPELTVSVNDDGTLEMDDILLEESGDVMQYQGISLEEAAKLAEKYGRGSLEEQLNTEASYLTESAWDSGTTVRGTQQDGQHFLNLILNSLWSTPEYGVPFEFEGKVFYFNGASNYVGAVKNANAAGVPISVELLLQARTDQLMLVDPQAIANAAAKPSKTQYLAPNVTGEDSYYYRAELAYLAERFSRENCHIDNWIVGNEVNMPMSWYFTGSSDLDYNTNLYALEYLAVYNSVHQYTDKSRVSFCFDHSWQHNDEGRGIAAKHYLDSVVSKINAIQPGVNWHMSYHMYPAYLPEAAIWSFTPFEGVCGRDLNPRHAGAEFVDGYNLFVMTDYVKEQYGTSHRIMCTEQGFSRYMGDMTQAVSLALSYYACKYDPMVDAFIINSQNEGGNQDFSLSDTALTVWNKLDDDPKTVESLAATYAGVNFADVIPNYGSETKTADRAKVKAFVSRIYDLALKRSAKDSEIAYWTDEICSGRMSGAEVAGGFFFSDEMKNKKLSDEAFIEICYNVMMDRKSDAAERQYWVDCRKNGFGLEGIFNNFCESEEFKNICNATGINAGTYPVTGGSRNMGLSGFMSRLYTKALERDFDENGLNYWCEEISLGNYTLMEVSTEQFFHSPEFLNKKLSDEEYIKVLYRTFFDREGEANEIDYWLGELNSGKDWDFVLIDFSLSKEFGIVKATYGL